MFLGCWEQIPKNRNYPWNSLSKCPQSRLPCILWLLRGLSVTQALQLVKLFVYSAYSSLYVFCYRAFMCLDRCYSMYISLRSRGVCSNSYSEMWLHTMEWWVSHSVLTVSRHLTLNSVDKEVYPRGRSSIVSAAITVHTNWVSGQCKYTFNISCVIQLHMMQKMSEYTWNNTMRTYQHKRSFFHFE